jgi:hypothetical protein
MNAEFNWWLLIVGLVVGAGLVWLVIADWSRREEDLSEDERAVESAWIAEALRERGESIDPDAAEEILALHRTYLRQTGAVESLEEPDSTDAEAWLDDAAEADWLTPEDDRLDRAAAASAAVTIDPEDREAERSMPPAPGRPSVRSTPLSPRGGRSPELESEPPTT